MGDPRTPENVLVARSVSSFEKKRFKNDKELRIPTVEPQSHHSVSQGIGSWHFLVILLGILWHDMLNVLALACTCCMQHWDVVGFLHVNPFRHTRHTLFTLLGCQVRFGMGRVGSSQSVHNIFKFLADPYLKCEAVWNLIQDTKYIYIYWKSSIRHLFLLPFFVI